MKRKGQAANPVPPDLERYDAGRWDSPGDWYRALREAGVPEQTAADLHGRAVVERVRRLGRAQ